MSDTTTSSEEGTVEYFHSISTIRYAGFTHRNMSDLERIIQAYRDMPNTQGMLTIFDRLREHILDRKAHGTTLSGYEEKLITQLYHAYRDLGYTGTRADMLLAVAKDLSIGTVEECLAGYINTKAVNCIGWKAMFDEHSSDPQAHSLFFDALCPDDALNVDPDFHLDAFFGAQEYLLEDGSYPITSWNTYQGTFYISLAYNFQDFAEESEVELLTLNFSDFTIKFTLSYNYSDSNDETVKLVVWKLPNDILEQDTVLGALKLAFATSGYDRFILVYNTEGATLRTMLDTVTLNYDPLNKQQPSTITVSAPIQYTATDGVYASIKEISHYAIAASATQQLFFLN